MRGKLFVGVMLAVLMPAWAQAADCVSVRQGDVAITKGAGCGELKLVSRTGGQVTATWVEFAEPGSPAEWRYNDWVQRRIAHRGDRLAIQSLYRSDRLISARYSGAGSVNVDVRRWTLFAPDDLVSLGAAANACWRQFAGQTSRGEAFAEAWPMERPWADRDFEVRRVGHAMREMIGPAVIDPRPSKERTQRVFVAVLKEQGRWSFSEQGGLVDFGELLGSASGQFFCALSNAELQAIAHPGVAIPP